MAGKGNCSLFCAPQPIARLIQLFPKLALVLFVIHLTVIIYSALSPSPHAAKSEEAPPGVIDTKLKNSNAEVAQRTHTGLINKTFHLKNDTVLRKGKADSIILQGLHDNSRHGNINVEDDNKGPIIRRNHPGR